jgi:hypothetical protein
MSRKGAQLKRKRRNSMKRWYERYLMKMAVKVNLLLNTWPKQWKGE